MFFCRGQALEPTGCYSSLTPKLFRLNFLEHYHLSRLLSQKMRPLSTHPLLSVYKHAKKIGKIRVSMPSRAYTSFLLYFRRVRGYKNCVNALSGLYLISTYPFKNLSFMRFPEPVFAGIYQNILTTAVFRAC